MDPVLPRKRYLELLHAALAVQQVPFARQAALKWLAAYPGDLQISLVYARALQAEQRNEAAVSILRGLLRADPEDLQAMQTLLHLESAPGAEIGTAPGMEARSAYFALTGRNHDLRTLASWGGALWLARQALAEGNLALARPLIEEVLLDAPGQPLAYVTHLAYLAADAAVEPLARLEVASDYARRWPDCLACSLRLADWMVQHGDDSQAVALLHQSAARDVSGQVACRMWGENHPYRSLWPERLQLALTVQIPREVVAALGWNRLPAGKLSAEMPPPVAPSVSAGKQRAWQEPAQVAALRADSGAKAGKDAVQGDSLGRTRRPDNRAAAAAKAASRAEIHAVGLELDRLARSWKLPGVTRRDGRYPVYVLFSLRGRLEAEYGAQVEAIEGEMQSLARTMRQRRGWGACVLFADQPACMKPFGLNPVRSGDPWELKLALSDLDAALARQGARIGAVLIVGGAEIVPFHHLPNPVDDPDVEVVSDNPYAARDENYFTPDWPVGRLPAGAGKDARLLIEALQRIRQSHQVNSAPASKNSGALGGLAGWLRAQAARFYDRPANFGYTAAIWQQAAALVYRPIGRAAALKVSPPLGIFAYDPSVYAQSAIPSLDGRLGYFNLHGLVDAPEWFGQRDSLDASGGPDYPVALRPEDICDGGETPVVPDESGNSLPGQGGPCRAPRIVFSEACYGLHIQGRTPQDAIALKFLQAGSLAVAGSTCMAYGSVSAPLVAADLLGHTFWSLLQEGIPAGEALRQAKLHLAATMHTRQGYLDGEDQKTLISFILFGDPLAQAAPAKRLPKSLRLNAPAMGVVHTVCERMEPGSVSPLSPEMAASVRRVAARYLPGMSDARLTAVRPRADCTGEGHACPTSQLEPGGLSASPGQAAYRGGKSPGDSSTVDNLAGAQRLVTLSKQVAGAGGVHPRLARLTLGEHGELIKLVVSR